MNSSGKASGLISNLLQQKRKVPYGEKIKEPRRGIRSSRAISLRCTCVEHAQVPIKIQLCRLSPWLFDHRSQLIWDKMHFLHIAQYSNSQPKLFASQNLPSHSRNLYDNMHSKQFSPYVVKARTESHTSEEEVYSQPLGDSGSSLCS